MAKKTPKNYTKTKLKCSSHKSAKGRTAKCIKKTHAHSFLDDIRTADTITLNNNNVIVSKTVQHKKPFKSLTENELKGLKRILPI